jgi:hypothetical protein
VKPLRIAAAGWILAAAAGCASIAVPPPPEAGRFLSRPGSLLERIRRARNRVRDLRGLVEITLDSEQERYVGKAVLILQAGGSIRLEPLNFFGRPLIYIIAHKGRLQAYQPGGRKHFRGPATPGNLRQWIGIPLSPKEVVDVLLAEVAAPGEGAQIRAAWDGSGGGPGAYRLEILMNGGAAHRWWVDARTFLPIRFQALDPGGEAIMTVRYDAYRKEADTLIPTDVSVEVGPEKRILEVHYGRVSVNRGLAPPAFRLPVPANVPVIPMGR